MYHEKADEIKNDLVIVERTNDMVKKWFRAIVYVRYYKPQTKEVKEMHIGYNAKRTYTDGELILRTLEYLEKTKEINGLRDLLRIGVVYAGWDHKPLPPSIRRKGRKLDYLNKGEDITCQNYQGEESK